MVRLRCGNDVCVTTRLPDPCQFGLSMLGHQTPAAIQEFWQHLKRFAPMEVKDHPALKSCDLSNMLPLLVHFDGAEMYKNAEYNIWSFSSAFSSMLAVDCIETQFLCCILPHSAMECKKACVGLHSFPCNSLA